MDILCVLTEAKLFGTAGQPRSTPTTWKEVCRVGWWVGNVEGGGRWPNPSPLSRCCSIYVFTHIFPRKAVHFFATRTRTGGQWVRSQMPFWKLETHILLPLGNMDLKWAQCTENTGVRWGGLCNCAPAYTCATHSLTESRVSSRVSWTSENTEQKVNDIWHIAGLICTPVID